MTAADDTATESSRRVGPQGLGASWLGDSRTAFEVWAPRAARVEVVYEAGSGDDQGRPPSPLTPTAGGYHRGSADGVRPGDTYRYRLHRADGSHVDRPDPASRHQPDGVHGPSAVVDPHAFAWSDQAFRSRPLHEQVLYEMHVGTFSRPGTFDGAVSQLPHLVELGITTIELMPVAQFPGTRNWGYDGVLPFAVQDSYGGPEGLRRLVDAAHRAGLGVILDVVHNHLGPEGNYLADFGPYFTDHHATPWGPGLNVDGPSADAVRRFVVEHAVRSVREFHLDGLRLDAVHGIVDQSAVHILEELGTAVHAEGEHQGRHVHVIAESDLCDPRLLRPPAAGGYGLDAQWADDFHHGVHVALTDERGGYYVDYRGIADLPKQLRDRWVYAGKFSRHRDRTIGRPAPDVPYDRFVVCVQNHDQVGNRMLGERLSHLVDGEGIKLAAAALLTSPFVPMLFMGEEYAEPAPFPYFISHTDPDLVDAVRNGRSEEFASFAWLGEPPDAQSVATFESARVDLGLARGGGDHERVFALYRELIRIRRSTPLLHRPDAPDPRATLVPGRDTLALHRAFGDEAVLVAINTEHHDVEVVVADAPGPWTVRLATADIRFDGPGRAGEPSVDDLGVVRMPIAARSAVLLVREPVDEVGRAGEKQPVTNARGSS